MQQSSCCKEATNIFRHNLRQEEKTRKKITQAGGVGNQHLPLALSTFLWQNSQIFGTKRL